MNLESFVRAIGFYTELMRKFILEDKNEMIILLLNQYYNKQIESSSWYKKCN